MDQQYSGQPLLDLEVDQQVSRSFREASRWAKFIGIVWAVCLGLILIGGILGGAKLADTLAYTLEENQSPYASIIAGGFLLILAVIVVVGLVLLFFLFRFCSHIKTGLERQEQSLFLSGLRSLKNYFTIYGIATLLYFVIVIIGTIFAFLIVND